MQYLINSSVSQNDRIDLTEYYALYHNIKGTTNADNGKIEEALKEFTRAIELNPNYMAAFFNRATIKADIGDLKDAKADFDKAWKLRAELDKEDIKINFF